LRLRSADADADTGDAVPDLMPVIDRSGLVEGAIAAPAPAAAITEDLDLDADPELDDAELLEDAELEDAELLDADAELDAVDDVELMDEDEVTPIPASRPRPPAPTSDPSTGLPVLLALDGPVIPARPPQVRSGWEELALSYASLPAPTREDRVTQQLALAYMWEEGAADIERAFLAVEAGLLVAPEHPSALRALDALADRHDAAARRIQALRRLAAEATLPDHVIAQGTRLAELHEARGERSDAEARWRWILSMVADHRPALGRITALLAEEQRWDEWVPFATRLAEAERDDLEPGEWAARVRNVADVVEQRLGRLDDAIDVLRRLVKQVPSDAASHERLAASLTRREEWVPAIETLRHANELRGQGAQLQANLAAIADLYELRLGFPDRAIDTWQLALRDAEGSADDEGTRRALDALVRLARISGKTDRLIALVDRRVEAGALDDAARVELLLAKAAAQRETFDQAGALTTLETIRSLAPDDDRVVVQMAELLRSMGDTTRAIDMLRERVMTLRGAESPQRAAAAAQLAATCLASGATARAILDELAEATALDPSDAELRALEARLAREVGDDARLVAALAASPDTASVLEAAALATSRLGDRVLATRLFARAQAETRACTDEAELELHRRAIEGLVQIRLGDGDTASALDWMARQVEAIQPPRARARLLAELGHVTWTSTRDLEAARAHFDAALTVDPNDPSASVGLGELMLAAGESSKAEAELVKAYDAMTAMGLRGRDPARALVALAAALEAQDRGADAYRRLTNALRHDADNLGIRLAIVRNRALASRWKDALTAVEQIDQTLAQRPLATFATDELRLAADAQVLAASAEAQVGTPEGAVRRLRRAIELTPEHAVALGELAAALAVQGQLVESAEFAARAAEHEPDVPAPEPSSRPGWR
jgi:tetratricopeptide (TPR) repeat protein